MDPEELRKASRPSRVRRRGDSDGPLRFHDIGKGDASPNERGDAFLLEPDEPVGRPLSTVREGIGGEERILLRILCRPRG